MEPDSLRISGGAPMPPPPSTPLPALNPQLLSTTKQTASIAQNAQILPTSDSDQEFDFDAYMTSTTSDSFNFPTNAGEEQFEVQLNTSDMQKTAEARQPPTQSATISRPETRTPSPIRPHSPPQSAKSDMQTHYETLHSSLHELGKIAKNQKNEATEKLLANYKSLLSNYISHVEYGTEFSSKDAKMLNYLLSLNPQNSTTKASAQFIQKNLKGEFPKLRDKPRLSSKTKENLASIQQFTDKITDTPRQMKEIAEALSKSIKGKITPEQKEQINQLGEMLKSIPHAKDNISANEALYDLYQAIYPLRSTSATSLVTIVTNNLAKLMSSSFVMARVLDSAKTTSAVENKEMKFTLEGQGAIVLSTDRTSDSIQEEGGEQIQQTADGTCHGYTRASAHLDGGYSGDYFQVTDWGNARLVETGDAASHDAKTHKGSSTLQGLTPKLAEKLLRGKTLNSPEDIHQFGKEYIATLHTEMAKTSNIAPCTWAGVFYFRLPDNSIVQLNLHLGDARSVSVSSNGQVENLETSNRKLSSKQNGGAFGEDNASLLTQLQEQNLSVSLSLRTWTPGSTAVTGSDGQFDPFEPGLHKAELGILETKLLSGAEKNEVAELKPIISAQIDSLSINGLYQSYKDKLTIEPPQQFLTRDGKINQMVLWSDSDPSGFLDQLHSLVVQDRMQRELDQMPKDGQFTTPGTLAQGFANWQREMASFSSQSEQSGLVNLPLDQKHALVEGYKTRCPKDDDHTFVVSQPPAAWIYEEF